eukprot:COSAG04_NODE_21271_length_376_cov_28.653430_1_plen_81_part_01
MELRHDEVGPIIDHLLIARHSHERLERVAIQAVGPLRLRDPSQIQHATTASKSSVKIAWLRRGGGGGRGLGSRGGPTGGRW